MCPSLGTEDGVVRYQLVTWRPSAGFVRGARYLYNTDDLRVGILAIELQRPE